MSAVFFPVLSIHLEAGETPTGISFRFVWNLHDLQRSLFWLSDPLMLMSPALRWSPLISHSMCGFYSPRGCQVDNSECKYFSYYSKEYLALV